MVNIEELIEKKRQELLSRVDREIMSNKRYIIDIIETDIKTLKQSLIDSKDSVISSDKYLELIENGFIYRKKINPKEFTFMSNSYSIASNGYNVMNCYPDGSILDKPFYITVIFEPIKGDNE